MIPRSNNSLTWREISSFISGEVLYGNDLIGAAPPVSILWLCKLVQPSSDQDLANLSLLSAMIDVSSNRSASDKHDELRSMPKLDNTSSGLF